MKESVLFLAPIFMVFVLTHMVLLGYGILSHTSEIGPMGERSGAASARIWAQSDLSACSPSS